MPYGHAVAQGLLILALTLTACDSGNDAVREDAADPMTAPTGDITFSDLVDGHSIVLTSNDGHPVCLRFTGPCRFASWDMDLADWFAGDYADLSDGNEPGTAGTLRFTWDDPDYAPNDSEDAWELVAQITFTSEIAGTFAYHYAQGDVVYPTVAGDFDIVEGHIEAADCGGANE